MKGNIEINEFSDQIHRVSLSLAALRADCRQAPSVASSKVEEFLELLTETFEELNVADEELRAQSEQLASTQMLVEVERQRYRDLFDFAPDGYLVTDAGGTIREANRAAASMLGKRPEFLVGKPLVVFLESDARRTFRSALVSLHNGRDTRELEIDLSPTGRPPFRAALTVAAMRDHEGKPVGLRWLLRDVTARHNAEKELHILNAELELRVIERTRELETANLQKERALAAERDARMDAELAGRRITDLVNGLNAVLWEADPATFEYTYVSEHAVELVGHPVEHWKRPGFSATIVHPDDQRLVRALRTEAIEERRSDDFEYRVVTARGRVIWVRDILHVVLGPDENIVGLRGVMVDVTYQHEAERALRESESRLRRLIDANIIGVIFCDRNGALLSANQAFLEMVGYDYWEIINDGITWASITPAEFISAERRAAREALGHGGVFAPFEKEFIRRDGTRVPVLVGGAYLDDAGDWSEETGVSGDFVCFVLDLTEQRRVTEALRLRDRAISSTMDGIIITDASAPEGPMIYVNPAVETITGYTAEELIGNNPRMLQGPDTDQAALDEIRKAIIRRRSCRATVLNYRKDGTPFWCELTISPVRSAGGDVRMFVGVMQDVTQRKEAEEEIRRLNRDLERRISEFQTLLEVLPVGIVIAEDAGCNSLTINPTMAGYLGQAPVMVPDARRLFDGLKMCQGERDLSPRDLPMYRAAREGRAVRSFEFEVIDVADRRFVTASAAPLFDERGSARGAIGAFVDITEMKHAERENITMRRAAEEANRAKDRFLAILSHELRTPLTPVVAAAQMLLGRHDMPGDLLPLTDIIARNIEVEVRLIDDLLDLTGIETGKLALRLEAVDIYDILGNVLQMFQTQVLDKRLGVVLEPAAAGHVVLGDPSRLKQIFWNLLKNAVKYTPQGGTITLSARNDQDGRLRIEVRDTGIGIDPPLMERIFEPFVQGEKREERGGFGGLGLGLAITRALTELHGGSIDVASEGAGHGSVFTILLDPVGHEQEMSVAPPDPQVAPAKETGRRILLVDDHHDTRKVLELLLRQAGHEVVEASSVTSALEAARAADIDMVISDIGLPDGTGIDLMLELRRERDLPGIALSGFGMPEDIRRSREAGFSMHLTKPVSFAQIQRAIEALTREADAGS